VNSKLGRNDPCWCGSGTKYKKCHLPADRAAGRTPDSDAGATGAAGSSAPSGLTSLFRGKSSRPPTRPRRKPREIRIKTADEIEGIRRACQLTRSILDDLSGVVAPGGGEPARRMARGLRRRGRH
jgi:methionyl aminopeptidase